MDRNHTAESKETLSSLYPLQYLHVQYVHERSRLAEYDPTCQHPIGCPVQGSNEIDRRD